MDLYFQDLENGSTDWRFLNGFVYEAENKFSLIFALVRQN